LRELESLVGPRLDDPDAQESEAMALVRSGAVEMVALSLGPDGVVLARPDGILRMPAIEATATTTVGAGDSLLAGLVLGFAEQRTPEDALRLAVAAATAAIGNYGTAQVHRAEVDRLYGELARKK
jgi:6-phosphofructokinase 2